MFLYTTFYKIKSTIMNHSAAIKLLNVLLTGALFLSSCEHEPALYKKPFKIQTATWYRVSPATPAPIEVNGTDYTSFLNFPGAGRGTSSYIGDCSIFFNQLAYGTSPEGAPAGSVAAALTEVSTYPITGAPLPLIQAGDFDQLAATVSSFHIPATISGKIINSVLTNTKGDAIFLSAITGTGGTFPISETVVGFNGKSLIISGRGKFSHAIGEIEYNGYFNLVDPDDAGYNAEGWIAY
jgi:hypothetical protein